MWLWIANLSLALQAPPVLFVVDNYHWHAITDFKNKRLNGGERKDSRGSLPEDGEYTWVKGVLGSDFVYGVKEADGYCHYECHYVPGPKDNEWMVTADCNYLARLVRDKQLEEKESDVVTTHTLAK